MRYRLIKVALAGLLLAPAFTAARAQTVDQANYVFEGTFQQGNVWSGQTFIPFANTSAGAGFLLQSNDFIPYSGTLVAELWSDFSWNQGAALLGYGSAAFSLAAGGQTWVDVFWPSVSIAPGLQYFLTVRPGGAVNQSLTMASNRNPYPGGQMYYGSPGGADTDVQTAYYSTGDLVFAEYSTSGVALAAPEPASVLLMAGGLIGLFGVTRIRRKIV